MLSTESSVVAHKETKVTFRKNSEKRKEKSRYAARARRSRESEIFNEMSALLPLHQTIDKSSTMRLAISLIRTRDLTSKCNFGETIEHDLASFDRNDNNNFGLIDNSLIDAFLIVLTSDGHIPYISENVEKYLGLKQIDLLGSTIFEFSHPCDHNDIRETLAHPFGSIPSPFLIRIKCTITSKGKTINLKSAAYKVIKLTGHWIGNDESGYLCLVGEPLACPTKIGLPIADHVFLSRHSPDMKFTDIDERFTKILGYEQDDLIGKSVYYLFHALDCLSLSDCFKTLFIKGQSETGYYRLLAKRGGYTWIQTQATLITDNHTQQPIGVVCVNYALSGIENREEIISEEQCQERKRESYHLVDKTNDVRIKLAASTLIDSNTTTTGKRIAVTNISDNNSNTSNSNQNSSRIDIKLCQQQQQQQLQEPSQSQQSITTISNSNNNCNNQFITSLSDYQLPSGILINTSENLLNTLVIDKSPPLLPPQQSSSCFSQVNSLINQQQSEEERQELKQQQQQYQHLQQQTCSQGQLLDHQHPDQLEESTPIDQLPEILSTSFVPQSAPPVQLQQAVPLSTGSSLLFTPLIGTNSPSPTPATATATIFAPRTADMNPGFLMPIGDDNDFGLTVLPDIEACDPEQDLTHLAPQAGDFCVPLEICPLPTFDGFSMDDILKEMGFVTNGAASDTVTSLSSDTSTSNVSSSTTNTTPIIVSGIDVDDSVNSADSIVECGAMLQGKSDPIVDNIVLSSTLTPTKSTIRNSNSSVSSTPVASSSSFVTSTKNSIPSSVITSIIGSKTQSTIDDTLSSVIKSNGNLMTPLATTTSTIIAVTGISSNVNAKDSELMESFSNDNNNNCNGLSFQSALTNTSVRSSSSTTTITRSPITVTSDVENIVDSINVNNRNCNDNNNCVDGNNIGGNVTCDAGDDVDCNIVTTDDNQHGDEEDALNFTDYLPTDSKLLPFIPTAVAEEEIQFSCDDDLTSETRGSIDTTGGCAVVTGGGVGVDDNDVIGDTNSLSDFLCNQRLIETPTIINQRGLTTTVTIPSTSTLSTNLTTSSKRINENDGRRGEDERKSIKNGNILPSKCGLNKRDDVDFNRVSSKCDFTSGKQIIGEVDEDGDDGDDVSSICSPSSVGSGVTCNSSSGNLLLGMALSSNQHGINGSSSPLHNDPFLSFTNGLGGLVSDNYLCSLSSSSSSSRLTASSPDFTLTSAGSINNNISNSNNSHHLNTKRPSSLCDSPPPSSCNSTLTSDLDLCGSFVPEDDDEFDSLGGRSGCGVGGRNDRTIIQRHYDDEFPLLPNDESIWDTFIHSNDINDMINSDELLSSSTNHFPIDDYRLISVITSTKDSNNNNNNNSSNKSSSSSPSLSTPTSKATTNSINSMPSSLSSNINNYSSSNGAGGGDGAASGSDGSSEINNNNNKDGANESFLLSNSNLAMLLQGKDTSFKNCYTLTNAFDCNKTTNNNQQSASSSQYQQQQQQSALSIAAATASRNRFHNYSANLPATGKLPLNTSPCSTSTLSSTSSTSSVDNSRINSNYVIVQNNRSTIKTSSNHSNGTKDIIKSAQNNLQNCDMSRNEIDRKSDYFTLDSEMKKYRTMADSVYSKLGPSYVKIARKLAYNSSSSSSSSASMPSPKRAYLPSKSSMENNYKRMKLPSTLPSMQGTSVLMNLLVNGEDVTNGYSRFQQQSHLKNNSINVNIG